MIYIGVDAGRDGGIAVLRDNELIFTADTSKGAGQFFNLLKNLKSTETIACIEDLHAIFGARAASTFSFGKSVGYWYGIFDLLGISLYKVKPKVWQETITTPPLKLSTRGLSKYMKAKLKKEHKINLKLEAIRTANVLFPGVNIKHDGVADAVCIAAYLRHWLKQQFPNQGVN